MSFSEVSGLPPTSLDSESIIEMEGVLDARLLGRELIVGLPLFDTRPGRGSAGRR